MKGIIFTGGEAPEKKYFKRDISPGDYIVAADSGLETALRYGYTPDMVVGDMDSLKNKTFLDEIPSDCVKMFPEDKDQTDTEIALEVLEKKGVENVVLVGGGGGRLDHLLGIVSIFDRKYCPDVWYTAEEKIVCVKEKAVISGRRGNTVSIFPAGTEVCRMKSTGLKWSLNNLEWEKGDAGISNVVVENPFTVEMLAGKVILISFLKEFCE